MFKTPFSIFAIAAMTLCTPVLMAQDQNENENDNVSDSGSDKRFWEAKLPGGSYMVALSRISSISMHSYTVKGAMVHEVAVETMGAALTRFYALEPLGQDSSNITSNVVSRAQELMDEAGEKVGVSTDTSVHKVYPNTTHAKTIEYRVVDKRDLNEIYKSLSRSWKDNRGRKITIK